MNVLDKTKEKLANLPEKKSYLDFILALLSIPVVLTVMISNINNLKVKNSANLITPTPSVIVKENNITPKVIVQKVMGENTEASVSPTPSLQPTITQQISNSTCKKEIGPINITYPLDNDSVNDDPVCIIIKHDNTNYCSVVWSYRINNGNWSEFSSNSPCLYNPPNGDITFDLRIQSTVSEEQTTLQKKFKYKSSTPSPISNASSSAGTN